MNYQESISRLEEASVFGIKPGLERMQKILAVLGNPEKACKMIHITGTNGKGSVAAMITSVLENTNLKVGRFTSPHLIDYTERIYLGGKDISREDFAKAATVVFKAHDELVAAGEEALTEFELLTAIAFWYFRENKADYAVMEVGMGGRFDATNVVMPVVSVITNVAMDHMQYLGNTLQEIAREKAGIIKKGTKLVLESQKKDAMDVLLETAEKEAVTEIKIADMHDVTECRYENGRQYFSYQKYKNLEMAMLGVHQYENAAAAILAAEIFLKDRGISDEKAEYYIREGIKKTRWEGRMEILSREPFFMVDGAHNGNGVAALAESLRTLFPGEKFHFVMGVMADKNYEEMIEELLPLALDFKTVTVESERALAAQELSEKIRAKGICDAGLLHSFDELMPGRLDVAHKTIAFGSLYFVGEIEKYFQDVTKITKNLQIY